MFFFSQHFIPALITLIIHGIVIGVMFIGWESAPEPKRIVPPNYIKAELVQLENKTKKKASAKKQPKKIDLTAKKREQERLKREAEKKRQAELKQKKEAEAKKAADAKKKKEAEAKRKAEAERKKQEELRLQQEFEQALEQEQGMLLEEEYAIEAQSYASRFRQRVESNWARPPSARTGMTCVLAIQLVPTGRIVNVTVVESSGNSAFDRSAIQAVKKVEIFPEAKEMSLETFERHYRNFKFKFNPQDLRL